METPSPSLREMVFDRPGHLYPGMPPRLPDGDPRRGKLGVREGAHRNGDEPWRRGNPVEDRRPALRAEREDAFLALVRDAYVLVGAAFDPNPLLGEARLDAERAARPALAGKAVAHRDTHRLRLPPEAELLTRARS